MEKYLTAPSSLLQAFCLAHASSLHHQPAANALFLVTWILTWTSVLNMHIDVAIALNRRHIVPTLVSTITQPPSCCYDSPVLVLQKKTRLVVWMQLCSLGCIRVQSNPKQTSTAAMWTSSTSATFLSQSGEMKACMS